jgi:hypothetical protein
MKNDTKVASIVFIDFLVGIFNYMTILTSFSVKLSKFFNYETTFPQYPINV